MALLTVMPRFPAIRFFPTLGRPEDAAAEAFTQANAEEPLLREAVADLKQRLLGETAAPV